MTSEATGGESGRDSASEAGRYATGYHAPVLCKAVVDGLITDRSGIYVDGTLGGGGHAAALLDALNENGRVIGIDRDEAARAEVQRRLAPQIRTGRLILLGGDFRDLESHLDGVGAVSVDGILLDLGVSSRQLDDATRGFSYSRTGALDMRMGSSGKTAADIVNDAPEAELAAILREYGEERRARRIAKTIVAARPVNTTAQLADAVRSCVPIAEEIKSLSRIFQALRIVVNDELAALESALESATRIVRSGGRLAVISYHSLEDRRVKRYLRFGNFAGQPVKDVYGNVQTPWSPIAPRLIRPDAEEIEFNPRSRSARLRIAERTDFSDRESPT
ncbi:MAG: 16S rRNA (cytosine(1402)-N(4))-methyltransferase RsmH [Rhodothermia bacterium]|nr:16S rRNA (cytosine(1402)-N(4))-methyltransferase RsmH [Rhodothermia bacterium]